MTSWRDTIESAAFVAAVTAEQRTVGSRVEMVDRLGNSVLDLPVDSGNVSFKGEQAEQWACSLTLSDPDLVPRSPYDPLDPRSGLRCRIWWRILDGGSWLEVPLGTYWLEDPDVSDDGTTVRIGVTGRDAVATARRGGYGTQTVGVSGYTVDAALLHILFVVAPTVAVRIDPSTVTLPATYELGSSDDPWDDVADIASMAGLVVRADREGALLVAPTPEPSTVRADLQEGDDCAVVALTRGIKTSSIVNRVVAVSTSPEVNPPIVGVVEDDDEASPTWVGRYGPYVTTIKSDKIATQEGAEGMARAAFERWRLPMETVTVTIPQRPDLGYRDLCSVSSTRAAVSGMYRVSGWELPLAGPDQAPAPMTVTFMTESMS